MSAALHFTTEGGTTEYRVVKVLNDAFDEGAAPTFRLERMGITSRRFVPFVTLAAEPAPVANRDLSVTSIEGATFDLGLVVDVGRFAVTA